MKIGILFGGPSREREIAFAGGRTVYDNLNKSIFEAIPIFIDSNCNFILLDWQHIYKGTIRDFYPPSQFLPETPNKFQVYIESIKNLDAGLLEKIIGKVGQKIQIEELPKLIDFAFLSLHGYYGEDGQIQGLLESLKIPYSGSGILPSSIGMDKSVQKRLMDNAGFNSPDVIVIERKDWNPKRHEDYFKQAKSIGFPLVVRPANQGSSIGVSIIKEDQFELFLEKVNKAFFQLNLSSTFWNSSTPSEKVEWVRQLSDIRDGLGFPLLVKQELIYHPEELLNYLNSYFSTNETDLLLESKWTEQRVIIESFIEGREFSCIVIKGQNGQAIALPPTEILKGSEVFDYRSKYLPGLSRKHTPINIDATSIESIRNECVKLFNHFNFDVYARIDGFIQDDGKIFLNDPNTTSGMLPSSFFFHQAAEIGLNPSQFISYIIRTSIQERLEGDLGPNEYLSLLKQLDEALQKDKAGDIRKKKIGVILGGYSFERHISVESGRNIYEKLSSSVKYEPIPIFLLGDEHSFELYQIPINLLLKDNADDIRDKVLQFKKHPVTEKIKSECAEITAKYCSSTMVFEPVLLSFEEMAKNLDGVFIALHGRPGEDGTLQKMLKHYSLPFNGSGVETSNITINKHLTNKILSEHGFEVANQAVIEKKNFRADKEESLKTIENEFGFPLIVKPVDDGCSSAVKVVYDKRYLNDYLETIFRDKTEIGPEQRERIGLKHNEEFPIKKEVLVETMIDASTADHFLEITGGLLTHHTNGDVSYEMFEPSEALAGGEVLSLEEKFLAGEGQNITPARFSADPEKYQNIAAQVKSDLRKAAEILGVKGYARIDAFVRVYEHKPVETIIIEVNSLPGMTPATCIFHQSALNGYKPYEFIDKILEFAFNEQSKKES